MPRLVPDLDAEFIRLDNPRGDFHEVATIAEAQGVMFDCPKCGRHSVVCWSRSRGVPDDVEPGPGRWMLAGTSLHDLTLNADPPSGARSVDLSRGRDGAAQPGCQWHGFVTNGEAA
jgi:hypothetical protein